MTRTVRTIAIKLFYLSDPRRSFAGLAPALIERFAESNIKLLPRLASDIDLAFSVGGLTMTISRQGTPMDLRPLAAPRRPAAATTSFDGAMRQLEDHNAAVVINLTGPPSAARLDTRLAVGFIAASVMIGLAEPEMVYWSKSNTLYTIAEFRSSTGGHLPVQPRRKIARPAVHHARPGADTVIPSPATIAERAWALRGEIDVTTLREAAFPSGRIRRQAREHALTISQVA